ncbi:MAG TPA: hypothetical protein PK684_09370, partial [Bacillota bacterium]|nr:hypothetical protein [Bacillota bacterium]
SKASSSELKDKASKAKRSADVFRNLLDNEFSDDIDMDAMESDLDNLGDFDFQSDTRGPRFSQEISLYDRVRAVIEQHHPEALPELERIKDDQVKIRFLVHRLEMEARDAADELDASADRMLSKERKMRSQRAEDLLAPEKERKRITAQKMEQYHKVFQGIREAIDNKVTLTPEQLVQLENIFIEYNEVMAPNSLEDSVPVRVMRKLGLLLDMGIDVRTDPLTGQRVPMYYWSVRGNIATYGKELRSLSALYNESTRSYEWTSLDPRNSPLAKLLEKFGGEEYVKEAQGTKISVSDDARGAITGFPRRTDVDRSGRSLYTLGTRGNPKQLLITKGIRTSSKPKMAVSRNTWYKRLKDHQKEGVKLALEALENYGAFILADGTGAGKTAQMLAVAEHYSRQGKKVLLVLHNAESFEEAFLRDAEVLGIPKTQLTFLTASEDSEKRGRMAPGKINAIAYNYLSLIKKDPALAGWPL